MTTTFSMMPGSHISICTARRAWRITQPVTVTSRMPWEVSAPRPMAAQLEERMQW